MSFPTRTFLKSNYFCQSLKKDVLIFGHPFLTFLTLGKFNCYFICSVGRSTIKSLSFKSPKTSVMVSNRMPRSEEHTSELQSRPHLVCRLLLEKKKKNTN